MSAVNVSTATGTTATAERAAYVGRFAPSPTGDLHLGSLLAAVGSYLDARHHGGRWLLRMEDLDTPRVVPGSTDRILQTLDAFGLHWDGPVTYQTERLPLYQAAIEQLRTAGHLFECSCSRRELGSTGDTGYPGTCRDGPTRPGAPTATRFRVANDSVVFFNDRVQGECQARLGDLGDFVIKRKDGIVAYQLAVTVDDGAQHVSDVVRGADLLLSTGWQIALQRSLALPQPAYAHLPLVIGPEREKLAKSRHSVPVERRHAGHWLTRVLRMLNLQPPVELENYMPEQILAWGTSNWTMSAFAGLRSVTARDTACAK